MVFPTHSKIADNVNDKTTVFNERLRDFEASMTEVRTLNVGSPNTYTVKGIEFYQACIFIIDDNAGAFADITITVPSIPRGLFAIVNDSAQKVFVAVVGQTQKTYIEAAGVGYFYFDGIGEVRTPHGIIDAEYTLVAATLSVSSIFNDVTFSIADNSVYFSALTLNAIFNDVILESDAKLLVATMSSTVTFNDVGLTVPGAPVILETFDALVSDVPQDMVWVDESNVGGTTTLSTSNVTQGTYSLRNQRSDTSYYELTAGSYLEVDSFDATGFDRISVDYHIQSGTEVGMFIEDNWGFTGFSDYVVWNGTGPKTGTLVMDATAATTGLWVQLTAVDSGGNLDVYFDNFKMYNV